MTETTPIQDRQFFALLVEQLELDDATFVLQWVAEEFEPEAVFSEADLAYWAEQNGYVLEE